MMNKLKIATVFSGIGAFEFALHRLHIPYEVVFACDNGEREISYNHKEEFKKIKCLNSFFEKRKYVDNLYCKNTSMKNYVQISYLNNFECSEDRYFQDVRLLDGSDFKGKVDIFVGGSPCQSFSSVGAQHGLSDTRGTLFYEYARLVKEIEPKVFIYENVRNLINHDKGKTWTVIKDVFKSLGYNIHFEILNSADFNIPQNRRRLFVVGIKEKTNFKMPNRKKLKFTMHDFLINNCAFGNFNFDTKGNITIKKEKGEVDSKYFLSKAIYHYVMKGGTKSFYTKPEINKNIARTILKTMGNRHRAGVDNYVSEDLSNNFGKVRMLTEREAHRLMGFTDDYKIVVSRAQAYKQAGNSIVVDVMMALIKEILKTKIFKEE